MDSLCSGSGSTRKMILCSNPRAQYESYKTAIESAISQVLSGSQYILGNNVRFFEREFWYFKNMFIIVQKKYSY